MSVAFRVQQQKKLDFVNNLYWYSRNTRPGHQYGIRLDPWTQGSESGVR